MLNKPKFMTPSTNVKECVIDINSETIPFSCIVDGNESVIAWSITIYKLNDSSTVLSTGKQTLSDPFFPVDEKNRNQVFSIDIKPYIASSTLINSKSAYFWTISIWGASNSSLTASVVSCEEVFYANSVPTLTIQYSKDKTTFNELIENTVFTSKKYSFKGIYTQLQGVPLKRYGWRLLDINSGQILFDTISKNQVYGTKENISFTYDGFLSGNTYSIELFTETQNGDELITDPISFTVNYKTAALSNDFKVESLKNESGIMCSWEDSIIIGGKSTGTISFKSNYPVVGNTAVSIDNNSSVYYDYGSNADLDIPENSWIVLSTQLLSANPQLIFSAEGIDVLGDTITRNLYFDGEQLIYTVRGGEDNSIIEKTYEFITLPNKYVWYIIYMSPHQGGATQFIVVEKNAVNGLYPSDSLSPAVSLEPSFGEWEV